MSRQIPPAIIQAFESVQSEQDLDNRLSKLAWTEFGLSERFIQRFGYRFRYVEAWKKWLYFDGKRWVKSDLASQRFAQKTITRLKHEALYYENQHEQDPKPEVP